MPTSAETTVLVHGFEAASAVVARANRPAEDTAVGGTPYAMIGGWWSVPLDTVGDLSDLLAAVGDVPAIAIQGGGARMAFVVVADREGIDSFS